MDDRNDELALGALLGNGISGWLNNITENEKRQTLTFLNDPCRFQSLVLSPEKIINCPILITRISRIVEKYGMSAIDVINELLWGLLEDGRNTPIDFERARDLTLSLKEELKGG